MTTKHETQEAPAHAAAKEPTGPPTLEQAARTTLAGLNLMRPRLAHGPGCPAEAAGPCTCGFHELLEGSTGLAAALQSPDPQATHT